MWTEYTGYPLLEQLHKVVHEKYGFFLQPQLAEVELNYVLRQNSTNSQVLTLRPASKA